MSGLFETNGAQGQKPTVWAPIFVESFWEGLFTNRPVLHPSGSLIENRYYGVQPGALIGGLNTEISVRNTIIRRYGTSPFSTATYPTAPNRAFSFELLDGSIQVLIDTGSSGVLSVTQTSTSSGGVAVLTGTFPAAGSNAYVGLIFQVAGFTNPSNNGAFVCTASSTTQLTLTNTIASAEIHSAQVVTAGAVYWDEQNGSKQLLFAKAPGAGQTGFLAVAGNCYMGDGVDTKVYTPTNPNGLIWSWGVTAPTLQPSVNIVESGVSAVVWTANTVFSTMGLIFDSTTNSTQQLQSVNASTTNTTQFGTSGNGQP